MFQPSPYSTYGDSSESYNYEAMLKEYAPIARVALDQMTDATQQTEVLRARLKNLKRMRSRAPVFLRGPFTARIRIAQAKLKAAERRVGLQRESETAQRTYRVLGQTAIIGGVLAAFALAAMFAKKAKG